MQTVVSEKWMDCFFFDLVECSSVSRTSAVSCQVSGLQLVESDAAHISLLPVAGWKFPAVFLGKVAFDLVGRSDGPPCLRVDSEEILLTLTDNAFSSR